MPYSLQLASICITGETILTKCVLVSGALLFVIFIL